MEMPGAHPRWGIEFDWLAVDDRRQVALLTSAGHGPVPLAVLLNVRLVDDARDTVERLPTIGEAVDTTPADGDHTDWLRSARQGFFAYDWNLWPGPYRRHATPTVPVLLDQLPADVRRAAELVRLSPDFLGEGDIMVPYVEPPGRTN